MSPVTTTLPSDTAASSPRDPSSRYQAQVLFYVGVPNVEAALAQAESLGGTRMMGPDRPPGGGVVVGHFADPEGHLIGLAAAA